MARHNVKLLIADGFFDIETATQYKHAVSNLQWVEKDFGEELENFNLIMPNMNYVFSRVLGEQIKIDEDRSGIFRRSNGGIHFEGFDGLNEWCFVVALERVTFNIYKHISDNNGDVGKINARTALDEYRFNYKNFFEWTVETNIILEPGQGIFFRPWTFHSFDSNSLVQYYRLVSDKVSEQQKTTILVMGLPGSGKTTLAKQLSERLNGTHLNADEVRAMYNDQDFSREGRHKQSVRMRTLANLSSNRYVIADFVCPTQTARDLFEPDFIIWMNTITSGRYEDTNQIFEKPRYVDLEITNFDYTLDEILDRIYKSKN